MCRSRGGTWEAMAAWTGWCCAVDAAWATGCLEVQTARSNNWMGSCAGFQVNASGPGPGCGSSIHVNQTQEMVGFEIAFVRGNGLRVVRSLARQLEDDWRDGIEDGDAATRPGSGVRGE